MLSRLPCSLIRTEYTLPPSSDNPLPLRINSISTMARGKQSAPKSAATTEVAVRTSCRIRKATAKAAGYTTKEHNSIIYAACTKITTPDASHSPPREALKSLSPNVSPKAASSQATEPKLKATLSPKKAPKAKSKRPLNISPEPKPSKGVDPFKGRSQSRRLQEYLDTIPFPQRPIQPFSFGGPVRIY